MAGVLTRAPSGHAADLRDTTRALIGMRRALAHNSPGGSGTASTLRALGVLLAVGSLLLGLVRFDQPGRSVDLLAALALAWTAGWVLGPMLVRGAGVGLRPEWFALLPIPPRRLAAGLLGASVVGAAPVITLLALTALPLTAAHWGLEPFLVALPATVLQLVLMVLLSRVVVAALAATLGSRRGQELGAVLMAVVIALASGGWSLVAVIGQQVAEGPPPALSTALRVVPPGWGPVAVEAAGRSDWPTVLAALGGLVVLCGLMLMAWAGLLPRTMRRPSGQAPGASVRRPPQPGKRRSADRWLPAGPTGAVVVRELHAWRRDPARSVLLLLALLISGLNLAVPAVAFDAPAALPWVAVAAALIVSTGAANVYGDDGTGLWLTRMVPGVERADVRGRQLAWMLVIAPVMVALTVALTAASGQTWAWPWILAALPAALGGTAGLMVLVSVSKPVRQKDPQRRSGPFDTSDDPDAAAAVMGQQYLTLLLVALAAVPGCAVVLLGAVRDQPLLQAVGVLVGVATGAWLYWWGGNVAARRLDGRGAALMDLLHVGQQPSRQEAAAAQAPTAPLSRAASALRNTLWTAAIVCVVPQGLVPLAFAVFSVDPEVKVWFAARYAPEDLQVLVALGFIVVGLLAAWWAETIGARASGRRTG